MNKMAYRECVDTHGMLWLPCAVVQVAVGDIRIHLPMEMYQAGVVTRVLAMNTHRIGKDVSPMCAKENKEK